MKPTTLLLAASLIANVALVGVFYARRSASSEATASDAAKSSSAASTGTKSGAAGSSASASGSAAGEAASDTARHAALGRAFARFAEKLRAAQAANAGDGKWWHNKSAGSSLSREQMAQARRELSDAMFAAFGDDLGIGGIDSSRLSFLSPEKRDKLRGILGDYDELMAKFGAQGGIQLASDKAQLKLLTAERDRDIAALLTPDELADYQMRTSATANALRNRYGDGITSEEEFKQLYALQKTFDDKFPADAFTGRVTPEQMKARADASLQLQADMRAAVGDDAYAALRRASDSDLKTIDALVTRLNLPADTTDRVAAERDVYSAESQRIMADTSVPFPQKREQLQALATRAKADLSSTLGAEAADAYAQRSPWMSMLQSGIGFSTTPSANSPGMLAPGNGAGPSIYPVMPSGAGVPNGTRQVINFVNTTTTGSGPGAGGLFIGGGTPVNTNSGTLVISGSTSGSGDGNAPVNAVYSTAPAPASSPQPVIVSPPPKP